MLSSGSLECYLHSLCYVLISYLQVQWDEHTTVSKKKKDEHTTIPRPTRVSPWEIEPVSIPLNVAQPIRKRPKLVEIASSGL